MPMINVLQLLVLFLLSIVSSSLAQGTNLTDYEALLAFKSHLILQPNNTLSLNWSSNIHFCNWIGVSCLNHRVVALQLPNLALGGTISPDLSNLTRLVQLSLSTNKLVGPIPSELGRLNRLRVFNVTRNFLQGTIPPNISHCQELEELYLSDNMIAGNIPKEMGLLRNLKALRLNNNHLTGKLPASLGNFSKLKYFYLHENSLEGEILGEIGNLFSLTLLSFRGNNFTGSIPPSIFNISELQIVDLSINMLSGKLPENLGQWVPKLERLFLDSNRITGSIPVFLSNASKLNFLFFTENDLQGIIPSELGRLQELQSLEFEYNRLSGNIPFSIFNISSLGILKARHNYLNGELPDDLGFWLPELHEIFLSHNQFFGNIPSSICNATKLVSLEVSNNSFRGQIPMMLGNLVNLQHLILQYNLFVNEPHARNLDFLKSLENCRSLEYLVFGNNPLNGILPDYVANLSSILKVIDVGFCEIRGSIPQGLGNLSSLLFLGMANNRLEGKVPSSLVGLQNLERLYLTTNALEGPVPGVLCSLKRLGILHLGENKLSGSIPNYLQNLTELRELSLAANSFHSPIPSSFWGLVKLEGLNLSQNLLTGSIPPEVGNLRAVYIMDLSSNVFTNEIPNSLGNLQGLISLYMSNNSFNGSIPETLSKLIVLESLDLSSNALSGTIPKSLQLLRDLKYLNLSFNRLQGEIPREGVFADISSQSIMGNPQLCGYPKLAIPLCPTPTKPRKRIDRILVIIIPVIATTLLWIPCFSIWFICCRKKNVQGAATGEDSSPRVGHQIITYQELLRATEHFNEANLVGSGSSSLVYRGILYDGTIAAIKVFNTQFEGSLKNFAAECEVMCNARHRNLVKVISTCSNLDFHAMVIEYMPNGSLDKWLYSHNNFLSLVQRFDIVTDIALALEYLHHECTMPIVHCDLKPSNVLLDEEMIAHVADFGIAKLLAHDQAVARTKTLGTIGYIAPEYGLDGHISTRGDVYSYGILLLETFTRKRPTDDMFRGDLSLHQWVNKSFPHAIMKVLDSNLLRDTGNIGEGSSAQIDERPSGIERLLVSIIHVGLLCLEESPEERTNMRDVVVKLKKIKNELNQHCNKGVPNRPKC